VDDHPMIVRGVTELLRRDSRFQVVGTASTGEEAVEKARELAPEIVVMDLAMPGMGGLDAIRRITDADESVRVLAVTSDTEEESLLAVLEAGGSGFVRKTAVNADLIEALQTVARQEVFLYPSAAKILLGGYRDAEHRVGELFENLTEQECDVLRLIAEGYTSKEIGKRLYLSPHTVDSYRSQVMQKLGLSHRSELVKYALRTGLLSRKTPSADYLRY
jgi:two-component system, NarL family, response regulator NreC